MIFDGHGDILTNIEQKASLGKDIFKDYHLPMYNNADVMGSIFVNYTDPYSVSQKFTFNNINNYSVNYLKNIDIINVVEHDLDFKLGKINVVLGIEGAKPLADLEAVKAMYDLGYRHIGLTWNERNQFACGVSEIGGLTELGEETVKWCNQNGMIIDYAHLNFQSFHDVATISTKPILFSHGNVKALCAHRRNLDDFQLNLIKQSDGVIGICAVKSFLTNEPTATIDDFIDHIKYVKYKIGIKHVGLGFDFCHYLDDIESNDVVGLEGMDKVGTIKEKLQQADFTADEIEDVLFKNMLRVVKANLKKD